MKLHTGLVFSACLSLGLISYACVNGDTVQNGATGTGGSTTGDTGGTTGNTGGTTGNTGGTTGNTGGSTGHTGGSTGTGGSVSHTGGTTGNTGGSGVGNNTGTGGNGSSTGGAPGTGGSGTATNCVMGETNPPSMKLITDFSDAVASSGGNYNFGSSSGQMGGTALYPSGAAGNTLSTGTGGLTYKGMVAAPTATNMYPNAGVVVFMNGPGCVNASAYTGVSFTISGSGTCQVVFAFGDKEHTVAADDPNRGTAAAGSYAGQFTLTVSSSPTTVKMPFSGTPTNAGSPANMVDTMNMTGVQWQLGQASTATTACTETLTITNVSFY